MGWGYTETSGSRAGKVRRVELYLLAGAITLVGTVVGLALHPVFYALPAAAGTVLVISALREEPATGS